jgi:predicted amidophosphoribosyltransferase
VAVDGGRGASGGLLVTAGGPYDALLRTAILAYKERGRRDLAAALARLLGAALALLPGGGLLVPVPSARRAAAARGGDHVARLARHACAGSPGRRWTPALRLVGHPQDSAGLSAAARAANLSGVLRAHAPPEPGATAVVVDDVVTTGATLAEARRALECSGWTVLAAATVAWTPRRHPPTTGNPGAAIRQPPDRRSGVDLRRDTPFPGQSHSVTSRGRGERSNVGWT